MSLVSGHLVKPTEPKAELDRFLAAMLGIAADAAAIERGEMDLAGEWDRPYSLEAAR
jgi:glycine dehydrogenase